MGDRWNPVPLHGMGGCQQMPYPPEMMGKIHHELIMRPTISVAFSSHSSVLKE